MRFAPHIPFTCVNGIFPWTYGRRMTEERGGNGNAHTFKICILRVVCYMEYSCKLWVQNIPDGILYSPLPFIQKYILGELIVNNRWSGFTRASCRPGSDSFKFIFRCVIDCWLYIFRHDFCCHIGPMSAILFDLNVLHFHTAMHKISNLPKYRWIVYNWTWFNLQVHPKGSLLSIVLITAALTNNKYLFG